TQFLERSQKDGKWQLAPDKGPDLGVSALAAAAVEAMRGKESAAIVKPTLDWLAANQKEDGGIYDKANAVYITAMSILALKGAGSSPDKAMLDKAVSYLRVVQTDEGDGRTPSSEDYGGIGYGSKGDVNLSTTHFAIEAVSEAGLKKDDEFYKKALVFLQRCQ